MNILRHSGLRYRTHVLCRRTLSSTTTTPPYVPPASLENLNHSWRPRLKSKPGSPSFFTGRADYYDTVESLESAIRHSQRALRNLHLYPLPRLAKEALLPLHTVWKNKEDMSGVIQAKLTTSRYRRITALLNELNYNRRTAEAGGYSELSNGLADIVEMFERGNKEAILYRGIRKPVKFDQYGRTYTLGKRKESSARVWIIPVKQPPSPVESSSSDSSEVPSVSLQPETVPVTTTTILINNMPLPKYFPLPADRERIIRPFKLAGLIGAYNVFALVRGGGTTGQSGAVAHGIAKGLVAHVPDVELILRRCEFEMEIPSILV
jgi:small subunit ribosomal protein S9